MTTVKEFKSGKTVGEPIYITKPYVIIGNKEQIVLASGTLEDLKKFCSDVGHYYDDCTIEVREYDFYMNDNKKIK